MAPKKIKFNEDENKTTYTKGKCGKCDRPLTSKSPGLVCSQCARAFHGPCLETPLTLAQMKAYDQKPVWRCSRCIRESPNVPPEAGDLIRNLRTVISAKELMYIIEEALDRLLAKYDALVQNVKLAKIENAVLRREIHKLGGEYPKEMMAIVMKRYMIKQKAMPAPKPILKRKGKEATKQAEVVMKDFREITDAAGLSRKEKLSYWVYGTSTMMHKKWITHLVLLLFLIFLTFMGAWVFILIEGTDEVAHLLLIREERKVLIEFISKATIDSLDLREKEEGRRFKDVVRKKVENYEAMLIAELEYNAKILTLGPDTPNWNFWNAAFFCSTVYTTIGYGNIVPVTSIGRLFLIIYTIIGIPVFLIMLTDYGMLLTRLIRIIWVRIHLFYKTGSFKKPKQRVSDDETGELTPVDYSEFNVPVFVAILLLTIYLFIGGAIFFLVENWTYLEAFYFCFVSITTLGFGDFLPSNYNTFLITATYILFGLALTSMCINVFRESMTKTFSMASAKVETTLEHAIEKEHKYFHHGDDQDMND